jgi:peptidoglycan/xylan/chitin deacetylase (PgdA/CDA1 family)
MISSIKQSSFAWSKRLGLSHLVAQSNWRRHRLLILCYHGIALHDEHLWCGSLYVSAAHFRRHLELLRSTGCTVLPLGDALRRLYAHDLPERAVVLTFDDGYYDFQARAWPLLQEFGYPATVYLTTARMEHNYPIVNLFVSYMLWLARNRVLDGRDIFGLNGRYALTTHSERDRVVGEMNEAIQARGMTASQKDAVAKSIAERLELDYEALVATRVLTLLRAHEVAALARQGLDIQLHTHLHRTPEDPALFVNDVLRNRDIIEDIVGRRPTHLCYPSGVYRMSYLPALRREGLESATTCDPGLAARANEPLLLPRFVDSSAIADVSFEAWLSGVATCLPRRTMRAHPLLSSEPCGR